MHPTKIQTHEGRAKHRGITPLEPPAASKAGRRHSESDIPGWIPKAAIPDEDALLPRLHWPFRVPSVTAYPRLLEQMGQEELDAFFTADLLETTTPVS
jgi:hypothetical protein